jgi:hypothetical protein
MKDTSWARWQELSWRAERDLLTEEESREMAAIELRWQEEELEDEARPEGWTPPSGCGSRASERRPWLSREWRS